LISCSCDKSLSQFIHRDSKKCTSWKIETMSVIMLVVWRQQNKLKCVTGIFKFAWWGSNWECENNKTKCIFVVFSKVSPLNQCKTYCSPAKFAPKIPAKLAPFTDHLFFMFCLNFPWKFSENSCEIYHFSPNLSLKIPQIWIFGPQPIRSPEDTRLMSQVTHQAGFCGMNEWDAILT